MQRRQSMKCKRLTDEKVCVDRATSVERKAGRKDGSAPLSRHGPSSSDASSPVSSPARFTGSSTSFDPKLPRLPLLVSTASSFLSCFFPSPATSSPFASVLRRLVSLLPSSARRVEVKGAKGPEGGSLSNRTSRGGTPLGPDATVGVEAPVEPFGPAPPAIVGASMPCVSASSSPPDGPDALKHGQKEDPSVETSTFAVASSHAPLSLPPLRPPSALLPTSQQGSIYVVV